MHIALIFELVQPSFFVAGPFPNTTADKSFWEDISPFRDRQVCVCGDVRAALHVPPPPLSFLFSSLSSSSPCDGRSPMWQLLCSLSWQSSPWPNTRSGANSCYYTLNLLLNQQLPLSIEQRWPMGCSIFAVIAISSADQGQDPPPPPMLECV